jgi:CBS domain-containing protein
MNEVMSVYPADMGLAEFNTAVNLQPRTARHVVITHGPRISGLVSVGEALRLAGKTDSSELTLDDLSDNNFTIARKKDVMFDVIKRMSRRGHKVALVVKDNSGIPRAGDLLGYITNDDIAESVAESLAFRLKQKN